MIFPKYVGYDENTLRECPLVCDHKLPEKGYFPHKPIDTLQTFIHYSAITYPFTDLPFGDDSDDDTEHLMDLFKKSMLENPYVAHIFLCANPQYVEHCAAQRLKRISQVAIIYDDLQTEVLDEPCLLADEYIVFNVVKFL